MNLFKKIFSKKDSLIPFSLSFLKTDIHSHLIPAIDDGAKSIKDTLVLARGLSDLGYKRAITTPHIMSDFYKNTPEIIRSGLHDINKAIAEAGIELEVSAAAEYYVDYDFIKSIGKTDFLTFGENQILVEFSFVDAPRGMHDAFFALQTNGYKPILAHPERYSFWHNNPEVLFDLKNRDIDFQINLMSLMGFYGEGPAKVGELLLKQNMVEWLGTDLHNEHQLGLLKEFSLKPHVAEIIRQQSFKNERL